MMLTTVTLWVDSSVLEARNTNTNYRYEVGTALIKSLLGDADAMHKTLPSLGIEVTSRRNEGPAREAPAPLSPFRSS